MPSITHEGLLQPFQDRPALAAELLTETLHIALPEWRQARLGHADLTNPIPTEFRADTVITLHGDDKPVQAVIVEVQNAPVARKRYTWPVYLTTLRARYECPAILLVISPTAATARACAKPIDLGHPGMVLTPIVLGPNQIPVVADPAQARHQPELAVLSTLAHGANHPQHQQILDAFTDALTSVDADRAAVYADIVAGVLPETATRYLEKVMVDIRNYQWKSDFAIRHISRGKAESVLAVLAARGIQASEEVRARITECTDLDQLGTWIRRAATAGSLDDLFTEEEAGHPA